MRRLLRLAFGATLLLGALLVAPRPSLAYYDQNNLIDDSIFLNTGTMNQAQIQSFLNSKVPTCDPGYTCLKSYIDPLVNKGSAQIIYEAAQAYGVNPQVILATLQKEQSLVTDTWPEASQYRSAMGYGCPDTSVCDTKYYGLYNQVENATWQLRFNLERAGGNTGWWNPNIGYDTRYMVGKSLNFGDCSGITVTFGNRATASLYRYTPHAYYSAPGCYYSGSINFVNSFESWFGPIHGDATMNYTAQMQGDGTIYLIDPSANKKYGFPNPETYMAYGFRWGGTPLVPAGSLNTYVSSGTVTFWVKGLDPTIYIVQGGSRHYVDAGTYAAWGSPGSQVLTISNSLISAISLGSPMTTQIRTPDGTVWAVTEGQRRPVPDLATFYSLGYSWAQVFDFPSSAVNYLPIGALMLPNYVGILINGDPTVYLVDGTQKWPVSAEAFANYGLSWSRVYRTDQTTGGNYTLSSQGSIKLYVKNSAGAQYLVVGGQKRAIPSSWGILPSSIFSAPSDGLINSLPTGPSMTDLVRDSSGSVYIMSGGQRKPVTSLDHFNRLGLSWSNVVQVPDSAVAEIPVGPIALTNYSGIMIPGDPTVYLIDGTQKWPVSADAFSAWGMSWGRVSTVDAVSAAQYATTGSLLPRVGVDPTGTAWLVDGGRKYGFPTEPILNAFGYTMSGSQAVSSGLINSIGTGPNLTRFIQASSPAVYYVKNGQKQWVPSEAKLYEFGGSWGSIIRLSDAYLSSLPSGPLTTP